MRKNYVFIALFLFANLSMVCAQQPTTKDKEELEQERKAIQDELKEIQGAYNKVKGQTKQSLGQLNMLNRKITLQERFITTLNKEVKFIDDDMYKSNLEIYRLQKQLDTLKIQYARTVVYAYKNRSSFDYVNFIFSASSFNDAIRRVSYLKSYRAYRENQVNTIKETQVLIGKRQEQQLSRKQQKNVTLMSQTKERTVLTDQRKEKDAVVSQLKSQEKDLQKEITIKKKKDRDIKNAIAAIIRREIEAAKKEEASKIAATKRAADEEKARKAADATANKTTTNTNTTAIVTAPAPKRTGSVLEFNSKDIALGNDFSSSKGKLPWPVDNGFVTQPFGNYVIEGTKLKNNNPGLTIATQSSGTSVKAVFEGTVAGVFNTGEGMAVVIRHGKYFTSYSNLSSANVTKGASVKTGQIIGKTGPGEDGSGGQLDFMLMVEANNVNPAVWLRRN